MYICVWIRQHSTRSHPVIALLFLNKGSMPVILHSLLPMVRVVFPRHAAFVAALGRVSMPSTRDVVHLHLHKQYGHDIALRALVVSHMPGIDDQVELSGINAVK